MFKATSLEFRAGSRRYQTRARATKRPGCRSGQPLKSRAGDSLGDFHHCGFERKAKESYTIEASGDEAKHYAEIIIYVLHCGECKQDFMRWVGVDKKGRLCAMHRVRQCDMGKWRLKIRTARIVRAIQNPRSEWCKKVARPADQALHYLKQLESAQQFNCLALKGLIHDKLPACLP